MRDIFLEVLRISLLTSILMIIIIITKDKLLNKYSNRFNYILAVAIIIRMILVFSIEIKIPVQSSSIDYYKIVNNLMNMQINNVTRFNYIFYDY